MILHSDYLKALELVKKYEDRQKVSISIGKMEVGQQIKLKSNKESYTIVEIEGEDLLIETLDGTNDRWINVSDILYENPFMIPKEATIIMFPTDEPTHIFVRESDSKLIYENKPKRTDEFNHLKGLHLYFLVNSEIHIGDWVYDAGYIFQTDEFSDLSLGKKIIATTDRNLKLFIEDVSGSDGGTIFSCFPSPSTHFLKEYCRLNGVDKCWVDYGLCMPHGKVSGDILSYKISLSTGENTLPVLIVNPDNTINTTI